MPWNHPRGQIVHVPESRKFPAGQAHAVTLPVQLAAPSGVDLAEQAVHTVLATASKKFSRHPVGASVGAVSTPPAEHE